MKLSIVVPVYNEIQGIASVLQRLKEVPIHEKEIVVVDDGSTDGTREYLRGLQDPEIHVFFQPRNTGKGGAVRRGVHEATGEYVVIQDADLEYDPMDLAPMFRLITEGQAEVVYGSRIRGHGEFLKSSYYANRFLTLLTNVLYGARLTDMETCYKMMPREVYLRLRIRANRFDMEPEITAKLLRYGYRIVEVPISYRGRTRGEGKKIGWRDGLQAIWTLVKYRI